jgi:uncharacterized protein YigA (DUF484 family)
MKLANLGLGIIGLAAIAALTATVVVQHQSVARLQDENQGLRQQAGQLAQVQAENERLANMLAITSNNASLSENQVRDLARLRAEIGKLRSQGDETVKLREENSQIRAELKAPVESLLQSQALARRDQCISNLTVIAAAKAQWASDNQKQDGDRPRMRDVLPYLETNGGFQVCPDGGTYILGAAGEKPRCNIPGHELP